MALLKNSSHSCQLDCHCFSSASLKGAAGFLASTLAGALNASLMATPLSLASALLNFKELSISLTSTTFSLGKNSVTVFSISARDSFKSILTADSLGSAKRVINS